MKLKKERETNFSLSLSISFITLIGIIFNVKQNKTKQTMN